TPEVIRSLAVRAADPRVGHGGIGQREQTGGVHQIEVQLSGIVANRPVPHPWGSISPEHRNLSLLSGADGAVEVAEAFHLVVGVGPFPAGERWRRLGAELGAAAHSERPNVLHVRDDRAPERRRRRLVHPRLWWPEGVSDTTETAIAGTVCEDCGCPLPADCDPVRFSLAVGDRGECACELRVETPLLAGNDRHQYVMGR